jgi:hypothetical protein
MQVGYWSRRAVAAAVVSALLASATRAADPAPGQDINAELNALKTRIAELEAQQHENWLTKERESQIRGIVQDVLKDAKTRGQFADGVETGYTPGAGFYIQTPDKNFKLAIGGFAQLRYEASYANATNGRHITQTVPAKLNSNGTTTPQSTVTLHDPSESSGFDIRRARISFSGNAFSPDLTFKFEGDFYGNSTGNFTVTDAFVAYRFTDLFKAKIGSYKVPFAKAELTSDTVMEFSERAEELAPFDPVRALGVSLYGDLLKDQLSYEISANDGGNTNTLRRDDTVGNAANLDNRFGFYGRLQWAGAGKISDFADEPDLRDDNRAFIWMLGAAGGYESQNATNSAFPSPQTSTTVGGLSANGTNPGFIGNYNLNGDIFRGTLDWSAKYQGFSFNSAAYFQQVNANPDLTTSGTTAAGPYSSVNPRKTSFFEWGGYGQVGYFIIPQKLELVGRAGVLATEGATNIGEFYSLGANYYIYKHNFKIMTDVTYTPEAPYTDSATSLLQNTQDIAFRLQVQLRF